MSRDVDTRHVTSTGRNWFWPAVAAITLVAAVLRVGYVAVEFWNAPLGGDAAFYFNEANLLVHGHFFIAPFLYMYSGGQTSVPAASHPPLFTLVLAGANVLGVDTQNGVRVLCCILGAVEVVPVAMLGRAVGGNRVGILAAVLTALYVPRVITDGTVYSEAFYASLVALFLLAAYRLLRAPSIRAAVLAGVLGGLTAMTRGEGLLLVAVVGAVVVLGIPSWRRRIGLLAVVLATSVVLMVPWTIYNLTRFKDPVLVSTNNGDVVAGANCDRTYYGPRLGLWVFGCPHRGDHALTGDDSQLSRGLRAQGIRYARQHLSRVPVVVAARIGRTFHVFHPLQTVKLDIGRGWRARASLFAYEALMVLAAVGAYVQWRRDRTALLPFAGATLAVILTVAISFGSFRFRVPVDVSFLVVGAVALDALWARVFSRRDVAPNLPVPVGGVGR